MPRRLGTFEKLVGEAVGYAEDLLLSAGAEVARWVECGPEHEAFARLSDEELRARWLQDMAQLRGLRAGLEGHLRRVREARDLFRARRAKTLGFGERDQLRHLWAEFLDYQVAIDHLKALHSGFPALSPVDRRLPHARSFLLTYAAYVTQYHAGLRLLRLTLGKEPIEQLLDEPAAELGLPEGQYATLRWNVVHVADVAKVVLGESYLDFLRRDLRREPDAAWAISTVRTTVPRIKRSLAARAAGLFATSAVSLVKGTFFAAWFPLQRCITQWIGDQKLTDYTPCILPGQAEALAGRLRPGDILVQRRSWHLSNIGVPGFWPHAALYVGTPGEMAAVFGEGFVRGLAEKHAEKFRAFVAQSHRVVEAVGEGVVFRTIEASAGADSVGVLRPRRGAAEAVQRAFHYHGRPYDFDFDFGSDAKLVCSELIYKCYEGVLRLPLVDIYGRRLLLVNDIVRKFDREYGAPEQELDFVLFLDGREEEGCAVEGGVEVFRKSYRRPKWNFLQP